jgi:Fanconi anemia group M protein
VQTKGEYLDIGDYLFPGSTIVERKTSADFIASIYDKRLWIQAENMSQYKHPIFCVITGNKWKDFYFRKGRYTHKTWTGTLATLSSQYNISVLTFDDEEEFIDYLVSLDKKLSSEQEVHRPDPVARRANNIGERRENALCASEGISIKIANQLLECYGSIENLANESLEDLQKAPGIGPKKAKAIYELLH